MDDQPIKHGHLLFLAPGKLLKRAWQKKYFALYKTSGYAVQRAEIFDSQELFHQNSSSKIIPLNDCIKVAQAPQKSQQNVFEVITKTQTYHCSAETTQDLAEWVSGFQKVAFGGARCEMTTSNLSLNSSSVQDYDEEKVNEIYSPIYGSEKYTVQVMATDAAVACGLVGHYQLIVNQLELALYDDGSSPPNDKCLFSWSYRHIRRYGRNKDVFTFEAGRKCASGEGTFKFVTNEASTIFQSVQANTKNIKREGEDALGSRSGSSRSISHSFPQRLATDDEGSSGDSSFRSESAEVLPSKVKPIHPPPFSKPPRKGKSKVAPPIPTTTGDDLRRRAEPVRLEISKAARARLAKVSCASPESKEYPEPTYAEPEMRTDAWKMFGQEVDHFHEENIADDGVEAYYSSVPLTPPVTRSPVSEKGDSIVPKMLNAAAKRLSIDGADCYDHLSQFGDPSIKATSSGHIYTRLLSSSSSSSSIQEKCLNRSMSSQEVVVSEVDLISDGLPRFVQNEDIYTVVLKPNKKTVASPSFD